MISPDSTTSAKSGRSRTLRFVFVIGIVSLSADFVYEGGRSIVGPYLAVLGAIVGPLVVAGVIALLAARGTGAPLLGYRTAIAVLLIPALFALFFLWRARGLEPGAAAAPGSVRRTHFDARYSCI